MASDFLIEPKVWFGDWFRRQIEENAHIEGHGFFSQQVKRVAARLQPDRRFDRRFEVLVPWLRARTAFTAPGRYMYVSRGLLERCPHDEAVAFVIAHEIAHHDLGHLEILRGAFARHAASLGAGRAMILFFRVRQKRIYSPQWECDADRRAIELCVRAGYDGDRCLEIFRTLELLSLDTRDISGVFGPDFDSHDVSSPEESVLTKVRFWLWQRSRGYLPLRDRWALARRHLETIQVRSGRKS